MANLITLSRFPLLVVYLLMLYSGGSSLRFWAVGLILMIVLMDGLDGMVARMRGETSLLGSVLDIAMDRTLEYVLWVVFADLNLISVVVPIIVLTRGTAVDAVRAVGLRHGKVAFEQPSHPVSRFLISSRFMRSGYGVVKAAAFAALTLNLGMLGGGHSLLSAVQVTALVLTWLSVAFCLLRGLPVLFEGITALHGEPA